MPRRRSTTNTPQSEVEDNGQNAFKAIHELADVVNWHVTNAGTRPRHEEP